MSENHFEHLAKLVRLEEAEEMAQFREEFLHLTPEERERTGKALLRLELAASHYSPGGHHLLSFRYADGKPLPIYSFDTGDVVEIEPASPEENFKMPNGTVYEKRSDMITVAFQADSRRA